MKLLSFIEEHDELIPVEVELELWPGLPDIHFLGRADAHLKEAARRIKSAIRAQGFEFPIAQQILVNLRPSHLKKSSRGLELAVAAAYLMESGQVRREVNGEFYYGELSLTGDVEAPSGLGWMQVPESMPLVTGVSPEAMPFRRFEVKTLRDLGEPREVPASLAPLDWSPPAAVLDLEISAERARLLGVLALGGHSALFAGASGSGKTTAAKILHALQPSPSINEERSLRRQWRGVIPPVCWRPFIQPHHRIPVHSLVGGGSEAHGGELARADLGMLLFDEFLEFSPQVMESLREPLEQKRLRVSRGSRVKDYPVRAQFIATTNLCPCGDFIPGKRLTARCRFSLTKCRSYSERFSGPLLDRFEAVALLDSDTRSGEKVLVRDLRQQVEERRERLRGQGREPGVESNDLIRSRLGEFWKTQDLDQMAGSERRRIATMRLAQSFCDWEGSPRVRGPHLTAALELTVTTFEKLRRWDL
ncbi:MAG: ATP-binding protein [Bdellovibrionaceae bacterium]|nr:ATP-binding protein [Pseudobdellovibrionaceae bacterium]